MILIREHKLEEQLVPATQREFELLSQQMEHDRKLKKQLTTPIAKLTRPDDVSQYEYIVGGVPNAKLYPLISILNFIIQERRPGSKLLFSKAGDKFTGFLTYIDNGREVNYLKMASFYDDLSKANSTLTRDLIIFVKETMKKRSLIRWEVEKNNSNADDLYQKVIPRWFFAYDCKRVFDDDLDRLVYTIKNKI